MRRVDAVNIPHVVLTLIRQPYTYPDVRGPGVTLTTLGERPGHNAHLSGLSL